MVDAVVVVNGGGGGGGSGIIVMAGLPLSFMGTPMHSQGVGGGGCGGWLW